MGANKQSVDDTIQASPTNEHAAPGWAIEDGRLVPDQETRQRGYGSHGSEPGCSEGERTNATAGNTPAANNEQDPTRKALQPVCKKKKH